MYWIWGQKAGKWFGTTQQVVMVFVAFSFVWRFSKVSISTKCSMVAVVAQELPLKIC